MSDSEHSGAGCIALVGDIMLDRRLLHPRVFYHYPDVSSCSNAFACQVRIPFLVGEETLQWLESLDRHTHGVEATSHRTDSIPIELDPGCNDFGFPFRRITADLEDCAVVFGNLECPLSWRGRRMTNDGCYRADPAYALALATAGFNVLSFANNHAFDYGEVAFRDTLDVLHDAGIATIGAGRSLAEARGPAVRHVGGAAVAFLGYTMVGPDFVYATDDESGAAPFNPFAAAHDIQSIRGRADIVVVSVHWGVENYPVPWPRLVELAHDLIDCGADVVAGHHTHVPGSVEVYRNRLILYSLGNFVFGHDHRHWSTDLMVRLHVRNRQVASADLVPISGRFQPSVIRGTPSEVFRRYIMTISDSFRLAAVSCGDVTTVELQA